MAEDLHPRNPAVRLANLGCESLRVVHLPGVAVRLHNPSVRLAHRVRCRRDARVTYLAKPVRGKCRRIQR